MSQDDEWELQFEHIDWNDIVDAELDGDAKALEDLKEKSLELKRSFSCPSPTAPGPVENESPLRSTPPAPHRHFKVPHYPSRSRRTPKQRKPRPPRSHPYHHSEQEYPSLPPATSQTHSPIAVSSAPVGYGSPNCGPSYAEATQPRLAGKRSFSERLCLSPIDFMPKRNALQSTPEPLLMTQLETTPKDHLTEELMDISDVNETTPGGDSHPSKAMMAAQRRLFPPTKENTSPQQRTQRSASVSDLSLHQLGQRQKQIDYGKNTLGYQRYIQTLPKWQRKRSDPMTPDKNKPCSTRAWQGQVKVWRRALHKYDPPNEEGFTQFTSKDAALCGMDNVLLEA